MINILMPMAGKSSFFDSGEFKFPKPFLEVNGRPMIELVLEQYSEIHEVRKFIFVVNQSDCDSFHLDRSLRLLCDDECEIIKIRGDTKGAACSCLMAISHIDNEDELVIANSDQVISMDSREIIDSFRQKVADAGVVTFKSIHPNWSYVRLDDDGRVIETAEKKPISKNAIAGFYYFRRGRDFVRAAMSSIYKGANINDTFYIAPSLNELILENMRVEVFPLDKGQYHSFYSPSKISEYESLTKEGESQGRQNN